MAGAIAPGSGLTTGQTLGVLLTSPDPFRTFIEAQQQTRQQQAIQEAARTYSNPNLATEGGITIDRSLMSDPKLFDQAKVQAMPAATPATRSRLALESLMNSGVPGLADKALMTAITTQPQAPKMMNVFDNTTGRTTAMSENTFAQMAQTQPGRFALAGEVKQQDPTTDIRNIEAVYGKDWRNNPEALNAFNRMTQPMSVNVNTQMGDKAVTGVDAKRYETTVGALDVLDTMAPFLERMNSAMQAGAQTGFGQQWALPVKQAAEELFGVEIPGTSEQEVFRAVQNYLGPKMRTPGSGASSDRDVSLFLDSIPSLGKSEQGNRLLMEAYNKIRNRYTQVAQIQQNLLREFEYIPVGEERKRLSELGPIFSPEERKAIEAAKTAAPKAQSGQTSTGRNYIGYTPEGRRVYTENGEQYVE